MKRLAGLACVLAFASSFTACMAPSAPSATGSESQPIINGTSDTGDPAVIMVLAQVPGSMNASLCTGSVISPHVILTAAHCVDPATVGTGAQFIVFIGQMLPMTQPPASELLQVKETHFLAAFDSANPQNGNDVGVVILSTPTTITPIPYNRDPMPQSLVGMPARLVGYGITDPNDSTGATAGTRRTAPSELAHLDDLFVGLQDGSHGICEGDSGGPSFMTIGGTEIIVGLTSFGFQGCPLTPPAGTPAGFEAGNDTRVDTYTSFIDMWVTMFDPPAVGPGGMCNSDADCIPLQCQQTSVGKVCAQSCDPSAMPSVCPATAPCTNVDGSNLCLVTTAGGGSGGSGGGSGKKSSGCDFGGGAPSTTPAMIGMLLLALALRRRVRN